MSFSSLRMSIYMLLGSLVLSFVGSQVWALTMVDNPYVNFQANNCTIPAGKSMCPSTLYVTTYAGRTFSVANLNRGITTSNLLTPDNYTITPGSVNFAYTVSTNITGDAANYISYGDSNNLNLLEGTRLIARAITSAKCTSGTIWNGSICSTPGTASPIACTMEARMCDSGSIMPRNMNTCEWLPNQCSINPIDPLPPAFSSFSISCTKNTYMLWEAISCKIRWGTSIKTCWQTGKSAIEEKSCIYYWWTPDANGIDLSYNGSVSSPILWNYTLYARDSSGRVASTQVSYIDNRPQESIRMEVKSCTIENGKSQCAATVDVSAPAGKYFDLENVQRTTNSTNIIRPGIYTITTSVLGDDAANYLTYGINDLILKEWGLPVARASGNAVCAINTRWNGQICTGATSPDPISITSRVSMKTGNGDTIFSDELYKNISKNAYYPEEVTKNITLPTSTSVLLLSLASSKAQCSVTPNYKTDNGMTFSNNSKIVNRSDFPSFDMSVPSYSITSQIWSMFNGKLSTITVSCETSSESTKDFLIYKVTFWIISLQPTYIDFQANNCIIAVGKSTCPSSLFVRAVAGKYFDVTNVTRWLTTSNLLNPTNYISVIGSTTPMYTTTTHITGDASNYLKYGVNDLLLKEGSSTIAKAVATAECAKWSIWNGQTCSTSWAIACTDVVRFCEDGSVMPRDPNCGWLPDQCGGRVAQPLAISCSKSLYNLWETISCKISGWVGTKSCWQLGTKSTEPKECSSLGWQEDSRSLYYYNSVSTSILGEYALYVKDSQWTIASTKVSYVGQSPVTPPSSYIDFQANNCSIPAWQNKCASILYVKAPTGKYYSVSNLNRGITTSNLLTPKNYVTIDGDRSPMYTVGSHSSGDAANYITYGESNTLTLLEGTTIVARAIASAKCIAGTTWNGDICSRWSGISDPILCTMEARMCGDGSTMPRDMKSCTWLPGKCPTDDTVEINSINTINPTKPYGNPTIQVLSIGWMSVNTNSYVEISKAPTAPLKVEWQITSIRSGYSIKLTSNKSDFFIMMPVSSQWVWSTIGSSTPDIYRSRLVVEWDNLLIFSLIDDATRKSVTQAFVKVKVSFIRGGIIESPICMMADWAKGYCTTPPMTPTYPNCPSAMNTSKLATTNSFVYCPIDKGVEINPTNTINPKPPVRWTSGGIIAIPPTCIMAGWSTGSCLPSPTTPPTYPNCPKPGTSKVVPRYCPTRTGVIIPIENPTIPPCNPNTWESLTIGCISPVDVVIVDWVPLTPIEEALDAASRKRIDTMIARTRSRVADMSVESGLAFIDTSIKRILWLPNKTARAKLIDAYTLSRLQSLRSAVKWSGGNSEDYIGLVDNVLSN